MPLLKPGIAGFGAHDDVDFRVFKQAVYAAAQAARASVISTAAGESVTPNFHQADISLGDRALSVICNRTFPIVAIVERPVRMSEVHPVDVPELAETITSFGFDVPTAAELQRPLETEELDALSQTERKQAQYWKPTRVIQVVFNWWD